MFIPTCSGKPELGRTQHYPFHPHPNATFSPSEHPWVFSTLPGTASPAFGKQTESMPRDGVRVLYGHGLYHLTGVSLAYKPRAPHSFVPAGTRGGSSAMVLMPVHLPTALGKC